MSLSKPDRLKMQALSTKERRKALLNHPCELCGSFTARNVLDNSLLLCCYSHPSFCPAKLDSKSVCWFCGKAAIRKGRCGFVCGTNRKRGCQEWAKEIAKTGVFSKGAIPGYEHRRLEKFKKTCLSRFGVSNPIQSKTIQDKRDATIEDRFGMSTGELLCKHGADFCQAHKVTNVWQLPSVRERILQTNMERYGVSYAAQASIFKDKTKATSMVRYGVEHAMKLPETVQKRSRTNLERYGYSAAMNNPEVYKKALSRRYRIKNLILPSGRIVKCQGYEDRAILFHLRNFKENDILFNGELQIPYVKSDGTQGMYRPDFADKVSRTLIEVKSYWTLRQEKQLLKKLSASASLGWIPFVEIWEETGDCPAQVMGLSDIQDP